MSLLLLAVITPISRLYAPLPEDRRKPRKKLHLKRGGPQILGEKSRETFRSLLNYGHAGLWITTSQPEVVRKKHKLFLTPILWLTSERDDELSIAPTKLERVLKVCQHFLSNARDPAIFLEYPETIISANGLRKTLEFFKKLGGLCKKEDAIFIIRGAGLGKREIQEIKKAISG
ncbi:MAG: DUF835 domain-containing protein [Candidatus Hadarchaeales archaeon]